MISKAVSVLFTGFILVFAVFAVFRPNTENPSLAQKNLDGVYWFILHRKSNTEQLFFGTPGVKEKSKVIKTFSVKTGVPGESPTPLPKLLGKDYWLIVDAWKEVEDPDTAPYFLRLNIDAPPEVPYGPVPYEECAGPASTPASRLGGRGEQCNWGKPGYFGLHGTGNDPSKLSSTAKGSSGCIRHSDSDITYLYNLLDPKNEEIRYYVEDN